MATDAVTITHVSDPGVTRAVDRRFSAAGVHAQHVIDPLIFVFFYAVSGFDFSCRYLKTLMTIEDRVSICIDTKLTRNDTAGLRYITRPNPLHLVRQTIRPNLCCGPIT